MYDIKQSTALTVPIFAHDVNGDAVNSIADGAWTKRISKGSGAWAAMTVTITFTENGWYSVPLSTAHTDTNGILSMTFTASGVKQVNLQYRVQTNINDDIAAYVDTEVAAILAAVDTEVAAIKTKTDFLPSVTAGSAGGVFIAGSNAATSITTALTSNIIGNVTGNLSGSVGSLTVNNDKTGYTLSAVGIQALWDALTTALTTVGSIGKLIVDNLNAAITTRATPAQVNTEVTNALTVTTYAEPSGVVGASASMKDMLNWVKALARNKLLQTATTQTLRNDADGANIATAGLTDDGTTHTRNEWT
jgi:hypothetical protein